MSHMDIVYIIFFTLISSRSINVSQRVRGLDVWSINVMTSYDINRIPTTPTKKCRVSFEGKITDVSILK